MDREAWRAAVHEVAKSRTQVSDQTELNYFIILWWFLPYIHVNQPWLSLYMCSPSHLPSHPIPQGHPSAPALSTLSHASNLNWRSISCMVTYMFQCYSLKSSHPRLLPQSPKVCSLHLCSDHLFSDHDLHPLLLIGLQMPLTSSASVLLLTLLSLPMDFKTSLELSTWVSALY